MIRVAVKSLAQRKLRTALTVLAIVVGVGMVSAALVLGDSMKKGADSLSASSYRGTDAVVSAKTPFTVSSQTQGATPTIPASVLERVRAVPEVGAAVGDITDQQVKLAGSDGEPVGDGPYFGVGYDAGAKGAAGLTPFQLRQGRFARGADEVVVDAGTAQEAGVEGRRRREGVRPGSGAPDADLGHRPVRRRRLPGHRHLGRHGPGRRPVAAGPGGPVRQRAGLGRAGRLGGGAAAGARP